MIELKVTVDYLAEVISYNDFLELCYKVRSNFPNERFLYDIEKELTNRDVKERIFSGDFMCNLSIAYDDAKTPMITDTENIFTPKQLAILRRAGYVEEDSYKFTKYGIDMLEFHSDNHKGIRMFNHHKLQTHIYGCYCDSL